MTDIWTISHNGAAQVTFASLGLSTPRRNLISQGVDTFTLDAPGDALADPVFAYGDTVAIYRSGVPFFNGTIRRAVASGSGQDERISYEVAGPWEQLERCVYWQWWRCYTSGSLSTSYKCRAILGQNVDFGTLTATSWTNGGQIADAINACRALGAQIAAPVAGDIALTVYFPWEEVTALTCADVIIRMMRLSPDAVCWFDYSGALPRFRAAARSALTAVTIPVTDCEQLTVTPRYDLQRGGVVIQYEKTQSVDDYEYEILEEDKAGNEAALDCVIATLKLAGADSQFLSQKIEVEDFPGAAATVDWFKSHSETLKHATIVNINIRNVQVIRASPAPAFAMLPYELVEGQIHDWMVEDDDTIQVETVRVTAEVDYEIVGVRKERGEKIEIRCVLTDAISRTYRRLESSTAGEPTPVGLAAALYASMSALQHEGTLSIVRDDVTGSPAIGNVLNLSGGRTLWTTMRSLVQRVSEDLDTGQATITFGLANHLGAQDLLTLLRQIRMRTVPTNHVARITGKALDRADAIPLGGGHGQQAVAVHQRGVSIEEIISEYDSSGTATNAIELKPGLIPSSELGFQSEHLIGADTTAPIPTLRVKRHYNRKPVSGTDDGNVLTGVAGVGSWQPLP